jgi:hypothetical protein
MTLRLPSGQGGARARTGVDVLDYELAGEMAVALGRAGAAAEAALAALNACGSGDVGRPEALRAAARAVHAYFIQREACGLRRHADVIREYGIPGEVLARLGAS